VSHKPDRGWTPKAYKEREIPIPSKLAKSPQGMEGEGEPGLQSAVPNHRMPTEAGFLDCLKAVAERAKLDADGFWLHKFRATFATKCLWAGVDLRTVQPVAGSLRHGEYDAYLKPSRSQQTRDKVNEIFA